MQIRGLHHTSVPRPPGKDAHDQAVHFYSAILGLDHIPKPRSFENRIEVTWFRTGDAEIHVYAAGPEERLDGTGVHFCLAVDDLQSARHQLEAAGFACEDAVPIPHRPRFYTRDPFGNQIEITTIEGDYLAS